MRADAMQTDDRKWQFHWMNRTHSLDSKFIVRNDSI